MSFTNPWLSLFLKIIAAHMIILCTCPLFVLFTGGYKKHIQSFYIVNEVTNPLHIWPIWHYKKHYIGQKVKHKPVKHRGSYGPQPCAT